MRQREDAARVAATIADRLADPNEVATWRMRQGWWPQSLAHGAVGVALLHIERAHAGLGPWQRANAWLQCAAAEGTDGGRETHLYWGAPALAFALHAATRNGSPQYARSALATLDAQVERVVRQRLHSAHQRLARGARPALAEFDTIRGLAGLGALLLHSGHTTLLREVLAHLVRLTDPVKEAGDELPGWWSDLAPSGKPSPDFPGGHANTGAAHGVVGPLALLARAALHDVTVPGQADAIDRILLWLDQWQQSGPSGTWWPYWITRGHLRGEQALPAGPGRPSWCYGTAGVARAVQLAAIARGDLARQRQAETALRQAMTDLAQLAAVTDLSMCHGFAGLAHLTRLAAEDASASGLADCLPGLLEPMTIPCPNELADTLCDPARADIGLLEGAAGTALALHSYATGSPSASGWDHCFLTC
jgi:hypothetical protein